MQQPLNKVTPTVSARAAVALLVTTNGAVFLLLLLATSEYRATADAAMPNLLLALRDRVATIVAQWLVSARLSTPSLSQMAVAAHAHLERRIAAGVPSRSPADFARWIRATVEAHLDGDGDDGAPARSIVRQPADDAFGLAAAPRGERAAVIMAAMARLTPAERQILRARLPQGATWPQVAATLGVSVGIARAWHAAALARAQRAAVDVLAELLQDDATRQARDRAA